MVRNRSGLLHGRRSAAADRLEVARRHAGIACVDGCAVTAPLPKKGAL